MQSINFVAMASDLIVFLDFDSLLVCCFLVKRRQRPTSFSHILTSLTFFQANIHLASMPATVKLVTALD